MGRFTQVESRAVGRVGGRVLGGNPSLFHHSRKLVLDDSSPYWLALDVPTLAGLELVERYLVSGRGVPLGGFGSATVA
jgi:hypothetical protein